MSSFLEQINTFFAIIKQPIYIQKNFNVESENSRLKAEIKRLEDSVLEKQDDLNLKQAIINSLKIDSSNDTAENLQLSNIIDELHDRIQYEQDLAMAKILSLSSESSPG
jgi:hypothetical protein